MLRSACCTGCRDKAFGNLDNIGVNIKMRLFYETNTIRF